MASGLPVITATTTGAADLVTPGKSCPTQTTFIFGQALSTLASDREREIEWANARSIAEQHSWASMAQSYVDLPEELSK